MQTFTQKPPQTDRTVSSLYTKPVSETSELGHYDKILQLQHLIGNRALQRLLPGTLQRNVPIPDYYQGPHDTCQAASFTTALIIWDRERADPANPNGNIVGLCNAALIYLEQNRSDLITAWGAPTFNDAVATLTGIRNDNRGPGSRTTELQYQQIARVLDRIGDRDIESVIRRLGLTQASTPEPRNTLDEIFTSATITGLAPGQIAQIFWYVNTTVRYTDGRTGTTPGYHVFLIGRGQSGEWFLSDQGTDPPLRIVEGRIELVRRRLNEAATAGRSWIQTGSGITRIQLTWSGVSRIDRQTFRDTHQRLAPSGTFLAEVDASWMPLTGERLVTRGFVDIAYSLADARALFPGAGTGHGFLIGEMPAGVFNVFTTNPVGTDNSRVTSIDAGDSTGGLLVNSPPAFIHAWLQLRTSSATGSFFQVY